MTAPSVRRLVPLFLLAAISASGYGAIFTLAGEFRNQFRLSEVGVGVMVATGFGTGFLTQAVLSRYADRGHAVRMVRIGVAVLVVSMVAMAVGTVLWHFVVARALLGAGSGLIVPGVRRVTINLDPPNLGRNLGLLGSFHLTGFLLGPALAGLLNEVIGLRAPFAVMAVVAAGAALFARRLPADTGELTTERRIVRALLANRGIRAALCMTFAFYVMVGTWEALWAIMLDDLGSNAMVVGFTLAVTSVPMILLGGRAGALAQRTGPLRVAALGLAVTVPCMAGYGLIGSVPVLVALSMVQALGDSFSLPATRIAAAAATPPDQHASAQGLLGSVEVLVAGAVAVPAAAAYQHLGAAWTWFGAAALMLVAMGAGLVLGRGTAAAAPLDEPVAVAH